MVVLDAPLLYETGLYRVAFSGTVCVVTSLEMQLSRLTARDNVPRSLAQKKIDAQMPSEEKAKRSEFVIDNSGTLQETRVQVDAVMEKINRRWGLTRWILVVFLVPILWIIIRR
jgi:dephospho-CoA kinase